ncbi:MAG: GAF domain-containing protein, partial [Cyanobacteria bacterium P01_H01_bin.121]
MAEEFKTLQQENARLRSQLASLHARLQQTQEQPTGHLQTQRQPTPLPEPILRSSPDSVPPQQQAQRDQWLRTIVEGTVAQTGQALFETCVQQIATAFDAKYAVITVLVAGQVDRLRTLACWQDSQLIENYEYVVAGTPCGAVTKSRQVCCFPDKLRQRFPNCLDVIPVDAQSFLGVPILSTDGVQLLGHLAVLKTQPLTADLAVKEYILKLFASRVGAELERQRFTTTLQQQAEQERVVNRVVQEIRQSLDLGTIFTTAAREIGQLLAIDQIAVVRHQQDQGYWEHIAEYTANPNITSTLGFQISDAGNPLASQVKQRKVVAIVAAATACEDEIN